MTRDMAINFIVHELEDINDIDNIDEIDEFEMPLLNPPDYDNDAALLEAIEYQRAGGKFLTREECMARLDAAIERGAANAL